MLDIQKRVYFSAHHIETAALFARQAKAIEATSAGNTEFSADHWGYVAGSVLSSVAFLEAAINERFADAADATLHRLHGLDYDVIALMAEMWRHGIPRTARYGILDKFTIALSLARKPPMATNRPPWQPTTHLIDLRNYLTHSVPEWIPVSATTGQEKEAHKIARGLRGKFTSNPLTGAGNPYFPDKVLGHGCAAWAVKTSISFEDAFAQHLGIKPAHEHLRAKLRTE